MTIPNRFVGGALDLSQLRQAPEQTAGIAHQPQGHQQPGVAQAGQQNVLAMSLNMDNVEAELIKRSAQVSIVILIGTPRSPESEQLRQDFQQMVQHGAGKWVFRYINADTDPQVAQMFGIQGLPTTVALASGQPLANFEGGQPREALEAWVNAVVQAVGDQLPGLSEQEMAAAGAAEEEPAEDPRFAPATEALNRGDFATAVEVYESILRSEPNNKEAKAAMDNAKLLGRLQELGTDPANAVAKAQENPLDLAAVQQAADAHIALGQPEAAFDALIHIVANGATPEDKQAARERLLEIFGIFEPTDPRVIAARTKLASALY
ncbi:tetratricopeptide repeat protein [Corynebacterium sp. 153RC1]|uniref:tetratricopeptide repeat protein n=1 Tax=unclassified Corynebacterium TaxID=2624378 RepID=UPI00211D0BB7|nr:MULTISPECIES: tetratricopeptide repeat protein [unclassified Corynebacterium]MCQ9369927.1 tetratricopeptide repeat protein [Corynebacterium sp. 35RC1]MCQ9352046.1 tetratricopeptide repeat protein [Corynebacterium sp. 209RC1]MCQ9353795.1 tetratricopeptide repeat protein [Corynebacterium sp. 1222RC1]MCQ9356221.1 tetratricopeptide repeat protein [Corynebacterium sp. 122RC1]MCQ9358323.1 tetratricopeptide repeat protein [Corynebacterium sp. 142RC1]